MKTMITLSFVIGLLMLCQAAATQTTNLSIDASTYMGAAGEDNTPVNVVFGTNNQVFVAGNFSGVEGIKASTYHELNYHGANAMSRGKVIVHNAALDSIVAAINIGEAVYSFEVQNFGEMRMAIAGEWGVSCLDSSGTLLWTVAYDALGGSGTVNLDIGGLPEFRVDIDDLGNVGVLNLSSKQFFVMNSEGVIKNVGGTTTNASTSVGTKGDVYITLSEYVTSIAIHNDTVFVGGYNNNTIGDEYCIFGGTFPGMPIHVPFVRAFVDNAAGNYEFSWRLFDIQGKYLGMDPGDGRIYHINVGLDGNLYLLGWQHGPIGILRWDGTTSMSLEARDNDSICGDPMDNHGTRRFQEIDFYNSLLSACSGPSIAYYARVDLVAQEIERAQFFMSRLGDGCMNNFLTVRGYIHADEQGNVYMLGVASTKYPLRDITTMNGDTIAPYGGGDGIVQKISADFGTRYYVKSFPKTQSSGQMSGIALRGERVAAVGSHTTGTWFTGLSDSAGALAEEKAINPLPFNANLPGDLDARRDAVVLAWNRSISEEELPPDTLNISLPWILHESDTLYVHPVDNSSTIKWGESSFIAAATDVWDGYANTQAIVASIGSGDYAAFYCDTLVAYGYNDWYLPAKNEMQLLYDQRHHIGEFDTTVYYWSSTDNESNYPWYINFFDGGWDNTVKFYETNIRCIRKALYQAIPDTTELPAQVLYDTVLIYRQGGIIDRYATSDIDTISYNGNQMRVLKTDAGIINYDMALLDSMVFQEKVYLVCEDSVTFIYNGNEVTYGTVVGQDGRRWMDRNLGASQVATSSTDHLAYGDLYQWGRASDGHQTIVWTSSTTSDGAEQAKETAILSTTDTPGHGNFITNDSSPYDWRSSQNNNLWQDVSGTNNPCPSGYRLATEAEWEAERQSWSSNDAAGAFASPLKLPVAGLRNRSNGSLSNVGSGGAYWSSTVAGTFSRYLYFSSSNAGMSSSDRAHGFSVRCLKD